MNKKFTLFCSDPNGNRFDHFKSTLAGILSDIPCFTISNYLTDVKGLNKFQIDFLYYNEKNYDITENITYIYRIEKYQ